MIYHILFYSSEAEYIKIKLSDTALPLGRNEQNIQIDPKIGDKMTLSFTDSEIRYNKWFKFIPTYPYTVIDKYVSGGYNYLCVFYSGLEKIDFERIKNKTYR